VPASGVVPAAVDEQLRNLKAPVIWMNRNPEETAANVLCDEAAGARLLVRHLLDMGHRRIGYLGFKTPHYSAVQRYEAIFSELAAAGLDTSGLQIARHADILPETAEQILNRPAAPTALICLNRMAYLTALHMMAERGLKVPGDISLCFFASPWEMAITQYAVTVLEVPEARMAVTAARMLLDLMEGTPVTESPKLVGVLLPGRTTAPPGKETAP
jgi:LacI family transcriptional regulator